MLCKSLLGIAASRGVIRQIAGTFAKAGYTLKAAAYFAGCSISTGSRSLKPHICGQNGRPGASRTYSEAFRLELIGFYCQHPPNGCGRWSFRWAATYIKAHLETLGASPSKSTIHRILIENGLKPHQSSYFLHVTDPDFFPKMEHLVNLYLNPPRNLYFFDECPGIQILKRLTPDLRTNNMRKRLEEFEYIRNGTINLLAFINFSDGKVFGECHADHKTATLLSTFRRHVATCPENEPLHYVMDNLSTHITFEFCQVVAELSGVVCPSQSDLDKQKKRYHWLMSAEKRIVIHFTPYHGSWLNLIEVWFGIMGGKVLGESYGSPDAVKTAMDTFIEAWNDLYAFPLRWSYKGEGLHQKVVVRFTQMLQLSADNLDTRLLTKQLRLMANIHRDYSSKIAATVLNKFHQVFVSKHETLINLIEKEEGPVRKKKAEEALASLLVLVRGVDLLPEAQES